MHWYWYCASFSTSSFSISFFPFFIHLLTAFFLLQSHISLFFLIIALFSYSFSFTSTQLNSFIPYHVLYFPSLLLFSHTFSQWIILTALSYSLTQFSFPHYLLIHSFTAILLNCFIFSQVLFFFHSFHCFPIHYVCASFSHH